MFGIEVGGGIMAAVAAFLMVVAVLALFVPFFILRIRNEMIAMNKTLKEILILLEQDRAKDIVPMRPSTEPLAWAKKNLRNDSGFLVECPTSNRHCAQCYSLFKNRTRSSPGPS